MKKFKLILAILITAILLILANAAYYFISNSQNTATYKNSSLADQTSALKTYQSEKLGFQLKYLSSWDLQEKDNSVVLNPPSAGNNIYFTASLRNDIKTLDELKGRLAPTVILTPIQVDTAPGFKYSDDNGYDNLWVEHSGKVYLIRKYFSASKGDDGANKILETFKFTN